MDLDGVKIKPTEGNIAVKFVDDDDDEDDGAFDSGDGSVPYKGVLAIVVGVGAKVSGIKAGDTVVMNPYAREGLKLGDNIVLCSAWDVAATVTG